MAKPAALERAAELERHPLYAPLGAQLRGIYHLFSGNEEEADVWQRRRERLALQSSFAITTSTHGVIYEALESRPQRRVALKMINPELSAEKAFRARFTRESQLVATLAPGFNPAKAALTVTLTRIMFPFLLLVALAAY